MLGEVPYPHINNQGESHKRLKQNAKNTPFLEQLWLNFLTLSECSVFPKTKVRKDEFCYPLLHPWLKIFAFQP